MRTEDASRSSSTYSGSVTIDADLIEGRQGNVVSLENGCGCCDLSEGLLMSAMRRLRREQPPEPIVLETSGVSDPVEIARVFGGPSLQPHAPLEIVVTIVDPEFALTPDGDLLAPARRQVAAADVAVLGKSDLVDAAGLGCAGRDRGLRVARCSFDRGG